MSKKRIFNPFITLVGIWVILQFAYETLNNDHTNSDSQMSSHSVIEMITAGIRKPAEPTVRNSHPTLQNKPPILFSNERPPQTSSSNPYTLPPRENLVEFQIQDGLAIAYGDVILGVPKDNVPGNRGIAEVPKSYLWDKAEVPFAISPELPHPERIENAIQYFHEHTSIKWIPFQGQKDAVVFEPGQEHCYSYVGRVGGLQSIKLAISCQGSEILHEMMHALGFVHEHSRLDRDQYIEILWPNIQDQYQPQFAMVPEIYFEPFRGTSFDYHSVMLYHPRSFAKKDDLLSIQSKTNEAISPVSQGLSELDLYRLNRLYGY